MKCILKIGYEQFLLPDDTGVATVLKVLAKAVRVRESLYKGEVTVQTKDNHHQEISMVLVPAHTKFVSQETGEPVELGRKGQERRVWHQPTTAGQRQLTAGPKQLGY